MTEKHKGEGGYISTPFNDRNHCLFIIGGPNSYFFMLKTL